MNEIIKGGCFLYCRLKGAYMKKNIYKYILLLMIAVGIIFAIRSYVKYYVHNNTNKVENIRIGVAAYKTSDAFMSTILSSIEEIAKQCEQENNVKIRIDISDGREDQIIQNSQIEKYIDLDYDVICVNMVDRTMAASIIDKAKTANIPLVFFNREPVEEDMLRWDKIYYVGADAKESGVLQGEIIVDAYSKSPSTIDKNGDTIVQYVILEGESGHQDSLIRTEWSIQTLKNAGIKVEKLAGGIANWDRNQGRGLMKKWISEYGTQIELVISNNDDMALGALDTLEEIGINDIPAVGIDSIPQAVEAIKQGKLLGTVVNDNKLQAKYIFDIAYALAKDQEVEKTIPLEQGKYIRVKQYKKTGDDLVTE